MPRTPVNAAARPAGPRTTGDEDARVLVRCPNPDCGAEYTVPARYAGKRARCTGCGAQTRIPATAAATRAPARAEPRPGKAAGRGRPAAGRGAGPAVVRIGSIGRGHAGKTALFHALGDGLVGDYLPSGLHVDAADPREVARMVREAGEAQRLLHESGLPPTLEVSQTRYCVYEGDRPRVVCRLREVIGQVLTHTLPDSAPAAQARYADYVESLADADVLWVVVPCPPADPGPRDRRRYATDLRVTQAYLREALRRRPAGRPAAVALVLSKADAMFATAAEARAALTDAVVLRALGPLVQLVQQSDRVSDAAAFPVSAFGFGKAVLRPGAGERHGAPGSADEPFGDEPIWLLKDGESPQPDNLDALFLWSLLLGTLNQGEPRAALDTVCRMLRDDLEAGGPWLVPVKGGVALAAL